MRSRLHTMCAIVRNRSQIRNARKGAPLKFALFYEIPVARPWTPDSEHIAYQNTLEQAIFGDDACMPGDILIVAEAWSRL